MNRKKIIWGAALFAAVIGIALWGSLTRVGTRGLTERERCDFDGTLVRTPYRVEIVRTDRQKKKFCSLYCAAQWHRLNPGLAAEILVADETSGKTIDSRQAVYVRSRVISVPEVKNDLHAFAGREEARIHARQYQGRIVPNPFSMKSPGE
jgi:hypothetical protein